MKRLVTGFSLLVLLATPGLAVALQAVKIAELPSPIGSSWGDFGFSVAINNGVALVGSPYGSGSGRAFLFDANTGTQLAELNPPEGVVSERFGRSVAMDSGMALVGSSGGSESAAYLYDANSGELIRKLLPDDLEPTSLPRDIGYSVAMNGGLALLGDRGKGAAYLFDVETGQQLAKLAPTVATGVGGFGMSVAIGESFALVGAPYQISGTSAPGGSVHAFDLSTLGEVAVYRKPDAPRNNQFGEALALYGDRAAIASIGRIRGELWTGPIAPPQLIDVVTGNAIAALSPDITPPIYGYGRSLAMDKGVVVVGSPSEGDVGGIDSVYFFDATSGERLGVIQSPLPDVGFGYAVAIDEDLVLAASPGSRRVFVYRLVPEPGTAWLLAATLGALTVNNRTLRRAG